MAGLSGGGDRGRNGTAAFINERNSESKNGERKSEELDRGFGFITPDEGDADVFVHVRSILSGATSLAEGATVQFEPGINERNGKIEARGVRVI